MLRSRVARYSRSSRRRYSSSTEGDASARTRGGEGGPGPQSERPRKGGRGRRRWKRGRRGAEGGREGEPSPVEGGGLRARRLRRRHFAANGWLRAKTAATTYGAACRREWTGRTPYKISARATAPTRTLPPRNATLDASHVGHPVKITWLGNITLSPSTSPTTFEHLHNDVVPLRNDRGHPQYGIWLIFSWCFFFLILLLLCLYFIKKKRRQTQKQYNVLPKFELTGTTEPPTPPTTNSPPSASSHEYVINVDGIPMVRYDRYRSEFSNESEQWGGFGSVYRCRNTLDGRDYAIKKIRITSRLKHLDKEGLAAKLKRVLREVNVLAMLYHPNVVRYFTAWIELDVDYEGSTENRPGNGEGGSDYVAQEAGESTLESFVSHAGPEEFERKNDDDILLDDTSCSSSTTDQSYGHIKSLEYEQDLSEGQMNSQRNRSNPKGDKNTLSKQENSLMDMADHSYIKMTINDSLSQSYVTYKERDKRITIDDENIGDQVNHPYIEMSMNGSGSQSYCRCEEKKVKISENNKNLDTNTLSNTESGSHGNDKVDPLHKHTQHRHILYIQMQCCSQKTLGHFLASPDLRRGNTISQNLDKIDFPRALAYFHQIAQGLEHVHSHGLVHRDLKPSNCFIDENDMAKIGDFGLSRGVIGGKSEKRSNGWKRLPSFTDLEEGVADIGSGLQSRIKADTGYNTSRVGTYLYASPEQSKGSDYDKSTDVYSLGIILFELFYPMYTRNEKILHILDLRRGIYPQKWEATIPHTSPLIHDLLVRMLFQDPTQRPDAAAIVSAAELLLGDFTLLSLDKSAFSDRQNTTFLRIETVRVEGIALPETIQMIKKAAAGVVIQHYGMRSSKSSGTLIMEFALMFSWNEEEGRDRRRDLAVQDIMEELNSSKLISHVREVK